uniref:Uncharacterized protein n=1 Tax=Amblyomma americanum TaxID=6943 RepID=A0A0C9SDB7_AMBAM
MGTVVLHLLTEEMVTMRFAVFSIAFCMLVGLATATTIGLPKQPDSTPPGGPPSRYPGSGPLPFPGFWGGSQRGLEPYPFPSGRSDLPGDSGKGGKKKNKKRRNRKRRSNIIAYDAKIQK